MSFSTNADTQEELGGKMEILVEVKNSILGDSVFWRGSVEKIDQIANIPARETAKAVAKDGVKRVCGMWHVSSVPPTEGAE